MNKDCEHLMRSFNGGIPCTGAVICLNCLEILAPNVAPLAEKWLALNFKLPAPRELTHAD